MSKRQPVNLKHLRYFTEVARRESVSAAARALFVTPQTISSQILELERSVGQPLFERVGKRMVLTTAGSVALDYASAIFSLGDELIAALRSDSLPRRLMLRVGIADCVPKLLTIATLSPLIEKHRHEMELICQEGGYAELLGRLAGGELDMVLGETTAPPSLARSLHTCLLSEDGISFLAAPVLVAQLKGRFPKNLHEVPFLANSSSHSVLSQVIEMWLAKHDVRPRVVGRIDDSALLKQFAHSGLGMVAVPSSIERDVANQYELKVIGRTDEVRQGLYLFRPRTRKPHPLVAEIERSGRIVHK